MVKNTKGNLAVCASTAGGKKLQPQETMKGSSPIINSDVFDHAMLQQSEEQVEVIA